LAIGCGCSTRSLRSLVQSLRWTSPTVLAHAIVKEGAKFVASGMNPMDYRQRGQPGARA
jgi:hypothetical protein